MLTLTDVCRTGDLARVQEYAAAAALTRFDVRAWMNNALRVACLNGHLDIVRWLIKHFALTQDDVHCMQHQALLSACANGHLHVAQWLTRQYYLEPMKLNNGQVSGGIRVNSYTAIAKFGLIQQEKLQEALQEACANGHEPVVRWLITSFDVVPEYTMKATLITKAAASGCPTLVQYIIEWAAIDVDERIFARALTAACVNGHLETAQWLYHSFHPRWVESDVKDDIMQNACGSGRLPVVQWVVKTFALSQEYMRVRAHALLSAGCHSAHGAAVVRWCVQWFDDGRNATIDQAARIACRMGHVETACWLITQYSIPYPVLADYEGVSMPGILLRSGFDEMLIWLLNRFTIPRQSINIDLVVLHACEAGKLDILQILVKKLHLTRRDLRCRHHAGLLFACEAGHYDVVRWLIDHVGLGRDGSRIRWHAQLIHIALAQVSKGSVHRSVLLHWIVNNNVIRWHSRAPPMGYCIQRLDTTVGTNTAEWFATRFGRSMGQADKP